MSTKKNLMAYIQSYKAKLRDKKEQKKNITAQHIGWMHKYQATSKENYILE